MSRKPFLLRISIYRKDGNPMYGMIKAASKDGKWVFQGYTDMDGIRTIPIPEGHDLYEINIEVMGE